MGILLETQSRKDTDRRHFEVEIWILSVTFADNRQMALKECSDQHHDKGERAGGPHSSVYGQKVLSKWEKWIIKIPDVQIFAFSYRRIIVLNDHCG